MGIGGGVEIGDAVGAGAGEGLGLGDGAGAGAGAGDGDGDAAGDGEGAGDGCDSGVEEEVVGLSPSTSWMALITSSIPT